MHQDILTNIFLIPYFVENLIILTENIAFCTSLALHKTSILLSNTSTGMQAVPKHVQCSLEYQFYSFRGEGGLLNIHGLIKVDECANCC